MTEKRLSDLTKNEIGTVLSVETEAGMRRRFFDIGCTIGAEIRLLGISPTGDPKAYDILGAMIAIRNKDAACIRVCVEDR